MCVMTTMQSDPQLTSPFDDAISNRENCWNALQAKK